MVMPWVDGSRAECLIVHRSMLKKIRHGGHGKEQRGWLAGCIDCITASWNQTRLAGDPRQERKDRQRCLGLLGREKLGLGCGKG